MSGWFFDPLPGAGLTGLPSLPLASTTPVLSPSSCAFRSASISEKEVWQSLSHSCDTSALGRDSIIRHALSRSVESASIRRSTGRVVPSLRIAMIIDITSAATKFAIRSSDTCSRERNASFVNVAPATDARKKSPATMHSRSFRPAVDAAAAMPSAALATSADPYVPSASTVVRCEVVGALIGLLVSTASSSLADGMSGSLPNAPLTTVNAAATSSASVQYSPSSHSEMRSTRGLVMVGKTSSALAMTEGRSCV
mmetsp:Transcript_43558/g.107767  ORF Transcript_43558/g.107767 Transcript_43558/m.107767 type:complete len:254 (-) Transcript_43558:1323-2084(-)